jgi:hypothetical protein
LPFAIRNDPLESVSLINTSGAGKKFLERSI